MAARGRASLTDGMARLEERIEAARRLQLSMVQQRATFLQQVRSVFLFFIISHPDPIRLIVPKVLWNIANICIIIVVIYSYVVCSVRNLIFRLN